jgi:hypothetical protein
MRTRTIVLALALAVLPWSPADAAPPSTVIDPAQPVFDPAVGPLAVGGPSEQMLAQTLTVTIAGRVQGVYLPISCGSGRLVLEIQGVANGRPDGTTLAARSTPAAHLPPLGPYFRFIAIPGGPTFAPGDVYAIVLRNVSGSCGIVRGPEGDPYAAGEGFFDARPNPPGWIPFSATETRLDLPFLVVVRAP